MISGEVDLTMEFEALEAALRLCCGWFAAAAGLGFSLSFVLLARECLNVMRIRVRPDRLQ